ncbi:folylpolyglutamate synthase/dihydrofolate synthase family protein [Balneolaceae bacterium ANBcel3]|nr:folylpolyglutamate synthase/dihydrofolate synthase family protein [Balneolaceae bacterium ANBcel3]
MAGYSTVEEVYQFLDDIPMFQKQGAIAAKPGLERIAWMCNKMGNPEKRMSFIHVAGTNGKGSVCSMLAHIYSSKGFKTGLYTSPHLLHVRERFRINGEVIPEKDLLLFMNLFGKDLKTGGLSYFEITTAIALWWFAKERVEIVVLETGLGGRLDATNIVHPLVSVITSIGYDHMDFLGDTLEQIAREKSGIIKNGTPVIVGNLCRSTMDVVASDADEKKAPLYKAEELNPSYDFHRRVFKMHFNEETEINNPELCAPVHAWNIAMCARVTIVLKDHFQVSRSDFCDAMNSFAPQQYLPGRFEKLHPSLTWYFDGAHNPEAVENLMDTIRAQDWEEEAVLVLSVMKDKAQKKVLKPFSVLKKNYYYVNKMERAADIAQIKPYLNHIKCLPPDEEEVIDFFSGLTERVVIFTGSFYFYGVVKKWISRIMKTI